MVKTYKTGSSKRICAACGRLIETQEIGKAQICDDCAAGVNATIDVLHEDGHPVNVAHVAKRILLQRPLPPVRVKLFRDIPGELALLIAETAATTGKTEREIVLSALWEYLS